MEAIHPPGTYTNTKQQLSMKLLRLVYLAELRDLQHPYLPGSTQEIACGCLSSFMLFIFLLPPPPAAMLLNLHCQLDGIWRHPRDKALSVSRRGFSERIYKGGSPTLNVGGTYPRLDSQTE